MNSAPDPSERETLTRRDWLTRGAGAVAATGATLLAAQFLYDAGRVDGVDDVYGSGHRLRDYFKSIEFPDSNPLISIATGRDDQIVRMVRTAVEALAPGAGMSRFVARGDVVLIKPNVGFDRPPSLGATTHPEVVRALIQLCREAGARSVLVADNPIESPAACFVRSGIRRVADEEDAQILDPTPADFQTVTLRDRPPDPRRDEALGAWPVFHRPLAMATKVIGTAPVKDHNLCSASMNLKNWYGLLGGPRNRFHQAIHAAISDLALLMSPTLVVADATRVMMNNGPTGGRTSDVRPGGIMGRPAVIASVDPVACDAWCHERLLGRGAASLRYLDLAVAKIGAQIASGVRRYGSRDWRAYDRQGKVVSTGIA